MSITEMPNALMTLATHNGQAIGFKLGFKDVPRRFYSATGGISEHYRQKGVASQLIKMQHVWCEENGFKAIRTETKNEFRAMIGLNLKHGFEIIGTYTDHRGQPKIIFERKL
jgi:GNAT superfamily N-acetyltransferase